MIDTQSWKEAYKELSEVILAKMPGVKHIDLWNDQTSFERDEYPFGMPAVFLDYNSDTINTVGKKVQYIDFEVGVHLAVDTMADTYRGSYNKNTGIKFMDMLDELHSFLQGTTGVYFSSMNRISIKRWPTSNAGVIQYVQTYKCTIADYNGMKKPSGTITDPALVIEKGEPPVVGEELYDPE